MKIFFLLVFSLAVTGCTTRGTVIRESNLSLSDTRKVFVKLYGEPRFISENGRELFTQYMDKRGRVVESAKDKPERRYTHVIILGERRPYDISVNVLVQRELPNGQYETFDEDDALSKILAQDFRKELLKSLENRNIIDDFKAF